MPTVSRLRESSPLPHSLMASSLSVALRLPSSVTQSMILEASMVPASLPSRFKESLAVRNELASSAAFASSGASLVTLAWT